VSPDAREIWCKLPSQPPRHPSARILQQSCRSQPRPLAIRVGERRRKSTCITCVAHALLSRKLPERIRIPAWLIAQLNLFRITDFQICHQKRVRFSGVRTSHPGPLSLLRQTAHESSPRVSIITVLAARDQSLSQRIISSCQQGSPPQFHQRRSLQLQMPAARPHDRRRAPTHPYDHFFSGRGTHTRVKPRTTQVATVSRTHTQGRPRSPSPCT